MILVVEEVSLRKTKANLMSLLLLFSCMHHQSSIQIVCRPSFWWLIRPDGPRMWLMEALLSTSERHWNCEYFQMSFKLKFLIPSTFIEAELSMLSAKHSMTACAIEKIGRPSQEGDVIQGEILILRRLIDAEVFMRAISKASFDCLCNWEDKEENLKGEDQKITIWKVYNMESKDLKVLTCMAAMPPACARTEAPLKIVVMILLKSLMTGVPSAYLSSSGTTVQPSLTPVNPAYLLKLHVSMATSSAPV